MSRNKIRGNDTTEFSILKRKIRTKWDAEEQLDARIDLNEVKPRDLQSKVMPVKGRKV